MGPENLTLQSMLLIPTLKQEAMNAIDLELQVLVVEVFPTWCFELKKVLVIHWYYIHLD